MSLAKVCGLETEYGLLAADPDRLGQQEAAVAFIERCPLAPRVPFDLGGESPGNDARDPAAGASTGGAGPPVPFSDPATGDHSGFMLANGARLYADHGHPEYSTPECLDALDLVAADKAGERLVERCRKQLNAMLPLGQSVRLFKNNSDRQGHSYGCHENYLVAAPVYRALFGERRAELEAALVPFLISRIVVTGAGKVGSENGRPRCNFQLSQRADFFETVFGVQTMSRRPIVNTRDEPHADPARFARLHVIAGEANMAEVPAYLKIGTMQLLLAMLEDGAALPDLTLADPVAAMVAISHDPACRCQVELADGRRLSAVELQHSFAEAAGSYLARNGEANAAYGAVYTRWTEVLERLAADPAELTTVLDWAIKHRFLDDWRRRKDLDWSAAELRELDVRYHDVDPEHSVYALVAASTGVETVVAPGRIAAAEDQPPSPTRARTRGEAISGGEIEASGWGMMIGASGRLELDDPLRGPMHAAGAHRSTAMEQERHA